MATIASKHRSMIEYIAANVVLPPIKSLYIPPPEAAESKNGEFGAMTLEDDSVGLVYLLLSNTLEAIQSKEIAERLVGKNPVDIALAGFDSDSEIDQALAMGAFNAISQFIFSRSGYELDFTTNALDEIEFSDADQVGMVGFFPPLVQRLRERSIPLLVLELKGELVTVEERFEVTLDPDRLSECNKVICTATTLLNSSIEFLLGKCSPKAQIAVIGPTAGFLPDALFEQGVGLVGGSKIPDSSRFIENCKADKKWGETAQKYCLTKDSYPGYKTLVKRALA